MTKLAQCVAWVAMFAVGCSSSSGGGPGIGSDGRPESPFETAGSGSQNPDERREPYVCPDGSCMQVDCEGDGTTSITGRIFNPSGAVPLYNVIAYVPTGPLEPLSEGARCARCGEAVRGVTSALTDVEGRFRLEDVPVGENIPVVMQVGKWRRQVHLPVTACQNNPLPEADSRLPSNQSEGDLPQIAIATGGADSLECFLRQMGIDDTEFTRPEDGGRVHLYQGPTLELPSRFPFLPGTMMESSALAGGSPSVTELWSDLETLRRYDMVVLSCEGREHLANKSEAARRAMADYLDLGGRVFASHFHYVWFQFGPDNLPETATWQAVNNSQRSPFAINDSFPRGAAFADWLVNVEASSQRGQINLSDVRSNVSTVNSGFSTPWILKEDPHSVKYYSFDAPLALLDTPVCGRAVYTDIHVASDDRSGGIFPRNCRSGELSAQEKALLFLLFDLSACVDDEAAPPQPPPILH